MISSPSIMTTIGIVTLVASITACGAEPSPDDPYRPAASGLCEAAAKAADGELEDAGDEFYDTVHQPLHDLAAEVSEVDRVIAARLLEAKEAVESGLNDDSAELGDEFESLLRATDGALRAAGHAALPCSRGEAS